MNYIFLIFLIFAIFASNVSASYNFRNYNTVEAIAGKGTIELNSHHKSSYAEGMIFNSYNDFRINKVAVKCTLNYTNHPANYSITYNEIIPAKTFFELSELYLDYHITSHNVLSIGVFSFKYGAFSEYTRIGIAKSDALTTLYYINIPGVFYTYNNNFKLQIGYGKRESKYYKLPENRYERSSDGSDILFLFLTTNNLKFNFSLSKIYYDSLQPHKFNQSKKLGTLKLAGIGYHCNDEFDDLYYSILGVSETKFNGSEISPTGKALHGKNFNFSDEKRKYGYSFLFGVKKHLLTQFFNKDIFVGYEYFRASKYWTSYTTDLYNVGYYSWGDLGNSHKIYTGIEINPKTKISVFYQYQKRKYMKLKGGNSVKTINDTDTKLYLRLDLLF